MYPLLLLYKGSVYFGEMNHKIWASQVMLIHLANQEMEV